MKLNAVNSEEALVETHTERDREREMTSIVHFRRKIDLSTIKNIYNPARVDRPRGHPILIHAVRVLS